MKRSALITGVNGQDGSYLSELLLEKDYQVFGMIRRSSVSENQTSRIDHLLKEPDFRTEYGDLLDVPSILRLMKLARPNEVYNLASQSHVRVSFDEPSFTVQTNAVGVLNMLEAYRHECYADAKFYQASSSEMYGLSIDPDGYQRETTPMHPTSPYGCAKLFAYNLARHYRRAYNRFVANGILFNHTSPRRASAFVEAKIVKGAVRMAKKKAAMLVLGNPDASRDFGHSKDYTKAMWMIMQHSEPDDFVIATGQTRTIMEIVDAVFSKLEIPMNFVEWHRKRYERPEDLPILRGDSSKARKILGWKPEYTFDGILDEMIHEWRDKS